MLEDGKSKLPLKRKLFLAGFLLLLSTAAMALSAVNLRAARAPAQQPAEKAKIENITSREIFLGNKDYPELNDSSTLADYLRYAAANAPGLEAAFYRWQAALEKLPQARSLPDPRFSYSYFVREVETRVGPQRQRFGLAQSFPWIGKLSLRERAALEQAEALEQHLEAVKLALFYKVKSAYYNYYYLSREIEITQGHLDLLKLLESVARTRYAAGEAPYSGVIKAQVELGRMEDRLSTLLDYRSTLAAVLNAALNRDVQAPLPWPKEIPREKVEFRDEEVLAVLQKRNPELKQLSFMAASEQTAAGLARKDFYPDITLGLDYIQTGPALMPGTKDDSKDPVMASISINLPLAFGKYRAAGREAINRLNAVELEKMDKQNNLLASLKRALFNYRDAGRKIELYRTGLIPKAEQALGASRQSFSAGKADFLELIDAQRTLLEFQLACEKNLVEQARSMAEIQMLTGGSLSSGGPEDPAGYDRK